MIQLVETGELRLEDLAADRLPPGLEFDTNGATIEDLLSMRSGISEYFPEEDDLIEATTSDPLRVWTTAEKLATVSPERGPVGQDRAWEYIGTNYLLLGLIIEQVTGRSVAEVLRSGVLAGDGFERLIYQPDERPTDPMAMPRGASIDTFGEGGGYLPSIANATMFTSEGPTGRRAARGAISAPPEPRSGSRSWSVTRDGRAMETGPKQAARSGERPDLVFLSRDGGI